MTDSLTRQGGPDAIERKTLQGNPQSIDEYLKGLDPDKRVALEKLRKAIKGAAPGAIEKISYGVPAFRLDGKVLVYFGAAAKHCSFFPASASVMRAHQKDLVGYDTSKGTIRFEAKRPLPATLVKKLVKARIAENAARGKPLVKLNVRRPQ